MIGSDGGKIALKEPKLVSERKVRANRENAKKSTGPKTPTGKAISRTNALKHGLFVNQITDFEALSENPQDYRKLLDELFEYYRPVGKAEEIEVERISLCCWRLKRAWRYENATNLAARRDFVRRELSEQREYCEQRDKEEVALISELTCAMKEVEETGTISQESKKRIFATMPGFEEVWLMFESHAERLLEESRREKQVRKPKAQEWERGVGIITVAQALAQIQGLSERRWTNVLETAVGQHAIPAQESLDKILRYEAAIERNLNRAYDRLERLQRRRAGEFVPPPLHLNVMQ